MQQYCSVNEEQLIAQGGDHAGVRNLPDSWIREHAPMLAERLQQPRATDQFRWVLMGRLLKLADPGLTRAVLLAGAPESVFCQADPGAAAEALLSLPRKQAIDALPKAARLESIRFLPLYADALRTPGYPEIETILKKVERIKDPQVARTLLGLLPVQMPADERLKIRAAKIVYERCAAKEAPASDVDLLNAARANSTGAVRTILTAALAALGDVTNLSDLEPAFPGEEWGQQAWSWMLAASPKEEARHFVARLAARGKVPLQSLLWRVPAVASAVLEVLSEFPDAVQVGTLETLLYSQDRPLRDEVKRRLDEAVARSSLPSEFPAAPAGQSWLRWSPSRIVLPCGSCGSDAVVLTLDRGAVRVDGPFSKNYGLRHSLGAEVLASIAAGKERECLQGIARAASSTFRDLDPCCKDCGAVSCRRCWNVSKTGTNGGLDIGVWYDVYTGTCRNGHPQEYSLITASYG